MPGYVAKALHRFQHPTPKKAEYAPYKITAPTYSSAPQLSTPIDESPNLNASEKLWLQEVVGTLLYYARAIGCTMLVALGTITAARTTHATAQAVIQLLKYAATNPDAVLQYHASDMVLHVHSDASYQSESQSRSRAGGFFFLSSADPVHVATPDPNHPPPPINGNVHVP
jgi:hypothetical protein